MDESPRIQADDLFASAGVNAEHWVCRMTVMKTDSGKRIALHVLLKWHSAVTETVSKGLPKLFGMRWGRQLEIFSHKLVKRLARGVIGFLDVIKPLIEWERNHEASNSSVSVFQLVFKYAQSGIEPPAEQDLGIGNLGHELV